MKLRLLKKYKTETNDYTEFIGSGGGDSVAKAACSE